MTSRIKQLEQLVRELYEQKHPERAEWADWLYEHHVFVVADYAQQLAIKYDANGRGGVNPEYSRAAALLHDIADAVMSRFDEAHETKSLAIARELLEKSGFETSEISLIVDDAIKFHSCQDGNIPTSLEGKILATADSLAHLKTDFYVYATWALADSKALPDVKSYVLKKIERDMHDKVFFDDEKAELTPSYQLIKELFSR